MRIDEIESRKAEIRGILDSEQEFDIDALTEEVRQLDAEKAEIEERAAKEAELRKAVEPSVIKEIKNQMKEERKMEEKVFTPESVEYRDAYMKNLQGKPMSIEERAALSGASYVIPTETLNKIYGKLEENQLIREIDALYVPGYVSVPTATTVNDANWIAMASASTDSSDAMGTVSLTAKKLIKTIEITADIQAMSIPAFQGWLVNKLAQKMEAAICAAIVNGAGSSTVPQGVGQCGIVTSTAIAGATLAKLSAFMGGLKAPYHSGAVWVMSAENFFTYVLPLASDSNGYLVQDGIGYRLLGHRVVLDDNCDNCKFKSGSTAEAANADHIIFGNFKEGYVFNFGEGIQVEADNSVSFRSGSTVYRAMALCDGAVADKDAFVWTTIAAS